MKVESISDTKQGEELALSGFLARIKIVRHKPQPHRRHYVNEEDIRVVLSRLPKDLLSRLKKVTLNDSGRGNKKLGYTTRGRGDVSLCAMPLRVSLNAFPGDGPHVFGALKGSQWPTLAVRRYMLYDVLLHEIGHLQIIDPLAKAVRRKFANELKAEEFAKCWRDQLWSEPFDHPDPVHNPPSVEETEKINQCWAAAHLEYKRGHNLQKAENREEAVRCFKKALNIYPEHALALEELGLLIYGGFGDAGVNRMVEAETLLTRALKLDPALSDAPLFLAMTLDELGKREESRKMFERAVANDAYKDISIAVYAEYLNSWGETDRAEKILRRLLRKDPKCVFVLRKYAVLMMYRPESKEFENTRKAIELLERAKKIDPLYFKTWYLLGKCLHWMGESEQAILHLNEARRLRPSCQLTLRLLEEVEGKCQSVVPGKS